MYSLPRSTCALLLTVVFALPAAGQRIVTTMEDGAARDISIDRGMLALPAKLSVENVRLSAALTMLQQRSGVALAFSPSLLPTHRRTTCECENATVAEALDQILTGTGFRYLVFGSQILVEPAPRPQLNSGIVLAAASTRMMDRGDHVGRYTTDSSPAPQQAEETATITGRVVEVRTQRPLGNAQVSIPGTRIGTLSDQAGRYQLLGVPAGEVTIRVQMVGFGTSEQTLSVGSGQTATADFHLTPQALALDEVVVTGTAGQARRREIGNTIAQISPAQIPETIVTTDQLLQNRAAGVTVTRGSAGMGAGAQIRLRGNVSVAMSNQPIVYIDGVRARSDGYPINAPTTECECRSNNDTPSPFNDINPGDIERIEIIKGPAATTLYGTEAAAGVIQIFTKRGIQGRPTMTLETTQAFDRIAKFGTPSYPYARLDPWLKTAHVQNYRLSVSGGSADVRYFVSSSFDNNEGVLPNDAEERNTLRGNISFVPLPGLGVDWNTSFTRHDFVNTPAGTNSAGLVANAFRGRNNYLGSDDPDDLNATLLYHIGSNNSRFVSGVAFNYAPFQRFSNKLVIGYDRATSHMTQRKPFGFINRPEGRVLDKRWDNSTLTLDYAGSYQFDLFSQLRSRVSWGGQSVTTDEGWLEGYGRGFPGPGRHTVSGAANKVTFAEEIRIVNAGVFAQNIFDLKDRYFLTLGIRLDGNSAFGENLGLQSYPKASASYVISDEPFWPARLGEVKLRGAYGFSGRAPGAFDAVRTWAPRGFGTEAAFIPLNVGNPDLGPERTGELEFGLDGSFFGGRLSVDYSHYRQRTTDALLRVTQIPSQGFGGTQLQNVGVITNRGNELAVRGTVIEAPSFAWMLAGTIATNKSRLEELGGAAAFSLGRHGWIEEGQPVPVMRGTRILNPDEIAEPILEYDYDFGPNQPTHTIGINTSLMFPRGIQLSAGGEYQGGHYVYDHAGRSSGLTFSWVWCEERAYAAIAQGQQNTLTARERALCGSNPLSDMWIYPWDHFKLRNVTLSVPAAAILPRTSNATLTLTAQNVYTWKNKDFLFMDPEMHGDAGLHQQVRFLSENVPPPVRLSASLRMVF